MRKINVMQTPLAMRKKMNIKAIAINTLLLAALCFPLSGCTKTVGEEFREIMADIDAQCRKDKMGPYLDKNDPEYLEKRAQTSCDILTLKPADPLATEEGRFAYSIKLPAPHDKLNVQYQKGMNAESYFQQLCEKEAGDFVFQTVDGVEGITIMRPLPQIVSVPMFTEMPTSFFFANWDGVASALAYPRNGTYSYVDAVEIDKNSQVQLIHYFLDSNSSIDKPPYGLTNSIIKKTEARYGYTFRAVQLPKEAWENGIRGGELIIMDKTSMEVLAFRRTFTKRNFINRYSAELMESTFCMNVPYKKDGKSFIAEVLKPAARIVGDKK